MDILLFIEHLMFCKNDGALDVEYYRLSAL